MLPPPHGYLNSSGVAIGVRVRNVTYDAAGAATGVDDTGTTDFKVGVGGTFEALPSKASPVAFDLATGAILPNALTDQGPVTDVLKDYQDPAKLPGTK